MLQGRGRVLKLASRVPFKETHSYVKVRLDTVSHSAVTAGASHIVPLGTESDRSQQNAQKWTFGDSAINAGSVTGSVTAEFLAPICSSPSSTMFSGLCFRQTHTGRHRQADCF